MSWRCRESQPRRRECVRNRLESNRGQTKCMSKECTHRTAQRMTSQPYVGMRILCRNVFVQVDRCSVVPILRQHLLDDARQIASVRPCGTVASLLHKERSTLPATAAKVQVVVEFVVCCGLRPIEQGCRRSFDRNDNRGVVLVGIDMTSQTIVLPSKTGRVVEWPTNDLPLLTPWLFNIVIRSHLRQRQHGVLVFDIRANDFVQRPFRCCENGRGP